MSKPKTDRRVRYTRQVLKESLMELMQDKPIDKISIKAICELADINRSTFYTHYTDQYELLRQIEEDLLSDINAYLDDYNFTQYEAQSIQIMSRIFEYILENSRSCQVLLGENGDVSLQRQIMMIVQRQGMREWPVREQADEKTMEYLFTFGVYGGIGIVQRWLQGGMKESPREMAQIVLNVTYQGLSAFA